MRKQKGNMYEFIDYTWNPLAGECIHDCEYCYVKNSSISSNPKYQGKPRVVAKELKEKLGNNNAIFVCSANDLFAENVDKNTINKVLEKTREKQKTLTQKPNTYYFQTKNPQRFHEYIDKFPENSVLTTTIETNREYGISKAPAVAERKKAMEKIKKHRKMITIEPVIDFDLNIFARWLNEINPDKITIGADSKNCGLPEPSASKIKSLINNIDKEVNIYIKSNLKRITG